MLRFTKYFLLIFLISTFIPLLMMFIVDVIRIDQARQNEHQQVIKLAIKQINTRANHYLYVSQNDISRILKVIKPNDRNLKEIKDFLAVYKIDWISKSDKLINNKEFSKEDITSYFQVMQDSKNISKLFAIFIVPIQNNKHFGLKIIKEVDLKTLHPAGPFKLEVYDNDTNKRILIGTVEDEFELLRKSSSHDKKHPFLAILQQQKANDKNISLNNPAVISKTAYIKGLRNTDAAFLKLSLNFPPPPPGNILPFNIPILPGIIILITGLIISLILGIIINVCFIQPLAIFSNLTKKVKNGDLSIDPNISFKQEEIRQTFENFKSMVLGLKEKEEIKNSFIENLTHDLKTPLISQERALDLLAKEFLEANMTEQFNLANALKKNNTHLLNMINKILEACRFDFEDHHINPAEINLNLLIDDCFQKVFSIAEEDNISLINNITSDCPTVLADSTTLKRVLLNLLSNSMDNISKNGSIKVYATSDTDKVQIVFEDNGTGISQDELPYIFDRYYSGKSDERKLGSGLGLYVCKKLVELNKGSISVETKVNEFTRFLIVLNKFK